MARTDCCPFCHFFPSGAHQVTLALKFKLTLKLAKLFGHEIVAVLCGLVWGLWVGFAIVAAGTFLGEVGNF